jgi:hypothetical protein
LRVSPFSDSLTLKGLTWPLVLVVVLTGCGKSKGPEVAEAHGIVTLDGKPVTEGFVFVTPSKGRMAKGEIQSDGSFVLGTFTNKDGVQVGQHPVTVLPPPAVEGSAPRKGSETIPAHYGQARSSGLVADIQAGQTNELKLELTRGGQR